MTKHLYIDFSHMCHRMIWSVREEVKQIELENKGKDEEDQVDKWGILRHVVLSNVFDFIDHFKPDEVIIACDTGSSWRKDIFEPYKGNRKAKRDEDDFDWKGFYELMHSLAEDISNHFPIIVLGIPRIEADDIISYLTTVNHHDNEIVLLTSDQDFFQLMRYDNVMMYDPIKKKTYNMSRGEALHELEKKILIGDKSDNIPNCRPRLGPKTAEKILLNEQLDELLENKEFKKRYDENTALIDLTKCPQEYLTQIKEVLRDYEVVGSIKAIFNYFLDHGLRDLSGRCEHIGKSLKPLIAYHESLGLPTKPEIECYARSANFAEASTSSSDKNEDDFKNTKFGKLFDY